MALGEGAPQLSFRRLLVDVGHVGGGGRALRALVRVPASEHSQGSCRDRNLRRNLLMHQRPGLASQGWQTHVV